MPHYISSGSYATTAGKYRFLILPRYGMDLDSIFKMKNKRFSAKTVLTVSIQILDILEYLHGKGYAHCDIKGSNLLLGYQNQNYPNLKRPIKSKKERVCELCNRTHSNCLTCNNRHPNHKNEDHEFTYKREQSANQVYLLDYGLASRFIYNNEHKIFCEDARKAHAGTVQFCSRDAHIGCTGRRSDLENLGLLMVFWLSSKLPWDDCISDPELVKDMKQEALSNLDTFLYNQLGDTTPHCINEYFKYVSKLSFDDEPDYEYCRKLFCKGLLERGYKNDNFLDFDRAVSCDRTKKLLLKKVKKQTENIRIKKQLHPKYLFDRKPLGMNSQVLIVKKPTLRSTERRDLRKSKFNWAKILQSDPENIIRQNKKPAETKTREVCSRTRKTTESSETETNIGSIDLSRLNPTYAMIEVVNRAQERSSSNNNNVPIGKNKGDFW